MNTQEHLNNSIVLCKDCKHWKSSEYDLGSCERVANIQKSIPRRFGHMINLLASAAIKLTLPTASCEEGEAK